MTNKCTCGRSPTGNCVGWHKLSEEDYKKKYKIKEIQRNKGLGEMSQEAFKHVLSRESFTKITIDSAKDAKHMIETCFGKDTQLRKNLLIDHSDVSVTM